MTSTARKLAQQPFFLFHIVTVIFVWVFVWRHTYFMDIKYDEAVSFHNLKVGHYRAMPGVANTHWLNSLLLRLLMTFNDSVIFLRLHSIIAFPFFAQAVYRLTTLIKGNGARLAFYCLAIFNLYVLEFFSMARGYGMALTFQVWTILFFIKAVQTDFNYRLWMKLVILSTLTLGANLSYQYTIIAVAGGYLLYCMLTGSPFSWYTNKQKRRITWLFVLLLFFTTVDLLFIKYYGKDLDFGSKENFVRSVFDAFYVKSLYQASYTYISTWLAWCTVALMLTASIYFIIKTIQQKKLNTGIIATYISGGIFLLVVIFHVVFNATYITNRTALQWYVPALLTIFLALGQWKLSVKGSGFAGYGAGVLTGLFVIFYFVTNNNSALSMEYYREDYTRQPLHDLYQLHPQHAAVSGWMGVVYKDYYSLVDPQAPPAKLFSEYPDMPLEDSAMQTLRESDYIISHAAVTTQYLDSVHIPYTIVKTYEGSDFKIIRVHQ